MLSQVRKTVKDNDMLGGARGVIVGLSGGADSVALLHALRALQSEFGYKLRAVHINHLIRGDEAERDERFCVDLCSKLEVPITVFRENIPEIAAERGIGLEEAGRDVRYTVFASELEKHGFDRIATAHHADDNLETFIFNLSRGAGLSGLCGIPAVRGNIIRPLIATTKSSILSYLEQNGLDFVVDSTNTDEAYTRNFIRHGIVPKLRELNPDIAELVASTCKLLRQDKAVLDGADLSAIKSRRLVGSLPDALLSRYIIQLSPDGCSPEKTHIKAAMEVIRSSGAKYVSFPADHTLVCEGDNIEFVKHHVMNKADTAAFDIEFNDFTEFKDLHCALLRVDSPSDAMHFASKSNIYNLSIYQSIDYDKIKGNLHIRSRMEGDTLFCGGIHRPVKKLLQSCGIPGKIRDRLPYICDDMGICWIPGCPVRDGLGGGSGGIAYFTPKDKQ